MTLEGCAALGTWAHVAADARDLLETYLTRWAHLQRDQRDQPNGHGRYPAERASREERR